MSERVKDKLLKKDKRINSFCEVSLGFTEQEAHLEATRCLLCKHQPCVAGCPVNVPIPAFIASIKSHDFDKAYKQINDENFLPAICGRVCPQEKQCEANCVKGIKGEPVAIGKLERFIGDWSLTNKKDLTPISLNIDHKVAIVGSGPASLACAAELIKNKVKPTIYEALHDFGGVLRYGIPEFRLPKSILEKEINKLKDLGVEFKKNVLIGKSLTVDDLFTNGYKSVFIGSGAGLPRFMGIPGENLNGVYSANEYLTRVNLMKASSPSAITPIKRFNKVAVIGGGNVALDVARVAKRLGAEEVFIVYRRSMNELPARKEEIEHALEEDIKFNILTQPVAITGLDRATGLNCLKMKLGEPDSSGRRRPIPIDNSNFTIEIDAVVIAVGQTPNPILVDNTEGLQVNKWGGIVIDENSQLTSLSNVYAGGDAVTGAATVISAMGAGKKAAKAILKAINNE